MTTFKSPIRHNKQIVVVPLEMPFRRSLVTTQLALNDQNAPHSPTYSNDRWGNTNTLVNIREKDEIST